MKYTKPFNLFKGLVKGRGTTQGRLLGLDIGDKYVGLAISDPSNKIASPLSVLVRTKDNVEMMATDFQTLISKLSLKGFVVGYPFDGRRTARDAIYMKVLVDDLCKSGKLEGIQVTYWDESFTSKNVEQFLEPLGLHPVTAKSIIDKFAAVGILQDYLDSMNRMLKSEEMKQKQVVTEDSSDSEWSDAIGSIKESK